jgi:hypothetical protein
MLKDVDVDEKPLVAFIGYCELNWSRPLMLPCFNLIGPFFGITPLRLSSTEEGLSTGLKFIDDFLNDI